MGIIHDFQSFSQLNEAYFGDVLGNEFAEFIKKYRALVKKKQVFVSELYVHFTNYKDNTLDRSAHADPNHSDPIGTYAYPLDYVLKHPSDIWYGSGAKYARVLRDRSKRKLILSNIYDESRMENYLNTMGLLPREINDLKRKAKKQFPTRFTGKNKFGKMFMTIVQMDLETGKVKSQKEQTDLLLRGFDAIEDQSKKIDQAIINDREPEQICFLRRDAFEVVDVVRFHGNDKERQSLVRPDVPQRKLANMVAGIMDDQLLGKNDYDTFWTKKGREIEIKIWTDEDYRKNIKMGQKNHRYGKDHDERAVEIIARTEYGKISRTFPQGYTFAAMLELIVHDWQRLTTDKQPNPNWVPLSQKVRDEVNAQNQLAYARQKEAEELEAFKKEIPRFRTIITKWNTVADIKFELSDDEDELAKAIRAMNYATMRSQMMRKAPEIVIRNLQEYRQHKDSASTERQFIKFFLGLLDQFPDMWKDPKARFYRATDEPEPYSY